MIKKNNKTCILCGQPYKYCNSCAEYKMMPRWMAMFDKDNCHEIFNIVSGFNQGTTSPEDALRRLKGLDLTETNLYDKKVQDAIKKILGTEKEEVKEVAEEKIEVASEEVVTDTEEDVTEPVGNATYIKTNFKRGRKPKNVEQ